MRNTVTVYRIVTAGALLSGLVALDLFLNFFCEDLPLLFYIILGGIGVWRGKSFQSRLAGNGGAKKFLRLAGVALAIFSAGGILVETVTPVNWDTKCSWKYCARAMSPGLTKSPFPVGTPTCSGWWTCANEYQWPPGEYSVALDRMTEQECPLP